MLVCSSVPKIRVHVHGRQWLDVSPAEYHGREAGCLMGGLALDMGLRERVWYGGECGVPLEREAT